MIHLESTENKATNLDKLIEESMDVFRSIPDNVKINASFSGGKDSTTFSILLCKAIEEGYIDPDNVEFVYADTRLEMPNLHRQAVNFLEFIEKEYNVNTTIVYPEIKNSYWVRFLGEGSIASNPIARWCVKPLKVNPIKKYFDTTLKKNEEYIVVVGIRLDESQERERRYKDVKKLPTYSCDTQGECFAPLEDEPRAFPILNWKNCNIWDFIQFHDWSFDFPVEKLREIYLNNDTARYGCWNCTVVGMGNHIIDARILGEEYRELAEWREMQQEYTFGTKSKYPEDWIYVKRIKGKYKDQYMPMRLTVKARQKLLYRLLRIQRDLRRRGKDMTLILPEEVRLIRDWWERRPDGDPKGREWKYYHETEKYEYDMWKRSLTDPASELF